MRSWPFLLFTFAVATYLWHAAAVDAPAERYVALMRDGTVTTGKQLRHFGESRPIRLDNKPLLDVENPVRTLRDTSVTPQSTGPRIEMINGDLLVGRPLRAVTGQSAGAEGAHLIVDGAVHVPQARVRLDWVRRVVAHARQPRPYIAGLVVLTDGREIVSRRLQFASDGVRCLSDAGIETFPLERITELHMKQTDNVWPLPGAAFLADEASQIMRVKTADGDVYTVPRGMLTNQYTPPRSRKRTFDKSHLLAVRPPWSLDLLYLHKELIEFQTYFDATDVPLSMLPVAQVHEKSGIAHLPWRRNASVHGGPLQCGDVVVQQGVGMHSHCRLTFTLPPGAQQFHSLVGLDRRAGRRGCVHCRVFVDDEDQPRWQREFLTGEEGVQSIGEADLAGAKTLTLEVDFADANRPTGADPVDVRDWVNWLEPTVRVAAGTGRSTAELVRLVPEISGWSLDDELLDAISLHPTWMKKTNQWALAIRSGNEPLVLTRRAKVDLLHAWLHLQAARDESSSTRQEIHLTADGEKAGSTMNGPVRVQDAGRFFDRVHILHHQQGREVTLRIAAEPMDGNKRRQAGLIFGPLRLQPLVRNLPPTGEPIPPDVPLTSLSPLKAVCERRPIELRAGKLAGEVDNDAALNVRGWQFADGFGVPTGSEISYELDPSWRKFVAVVGLADGWKGVGPYQLVLDGKLHWSSASTYGRNDQGEQIVVPIPSGHQKLTLRLLGNDSVGAFAHAGFLTE